MAFARNCMLSAGLALLGAPAASPQESASGTPRQPVFGAEVRVVHVNVSVRDAKNRPVLGLAKENFAVYEDGVRQDGSFFKRDKLPVSVVLLIDTSVSMITTDTTGKVMPELSKLPQAQDAAVELVRGLEPGDRAMVAAFSNRLTVVQDFTDDQGALIGAIRGLTKQDATALYRVTYEVLRYILPRERNTDPDRRLALIILSDGEDSVTGSSFYDDHGRLTVDEGVIEALRNNEEQNIIDLARSGDATIYPIYIESMVRPALSLKERMAQQGIRYFFAELARSTGGQALFLKNAAEIAGAYASVLEELRTQYVLGYVPKKIAEDGKLRVISVRIVDGPPGIASVRHRMTYAPSSKAR